jgi:hypothetical protein
MMGEFRVDGVAITYADRCCENDDRKFDLESVPKAPENFNAFPRFEKKGILE